MKRAWLHLWIMLGLLTAAISLDVRVTNAQTTRARQNYTIRAQAGQDFPALMQQAEIIAAQLIEQAFAVDPGASEALVQVSGERNGQTAPLLSVAVSRSDWQRSPNVSQWSQQFTIARFLLGFAPSQPSTPSGGAPSPTNQPPSPSPSSRFGQPGQPFGQPSQPFGLPGQPFGRPPNQPPNLTGSPPPRVPGRFESPIPTVPYNPSPSQAPATQPPAVRTIPLPGSPYRREDDPGFRDD